MNEPPLSPHSDEQAAEQFRAACDHFGAHVARFRAWVDRLRPLPDPTPDLEPSE